MSATPTTAFSSSRGAPPTRPSTSAGRSSSPWSSPTAERDPAARAGSPRRLIAIVNPRAGGGRCAQRAPTALGHLRAAGFELEIHETSRPGEATDVARRSFARGEREFLTAGGDGTAWEVLNGLLPAALAEDQSCRISLLPLGTGNSFVQHFLAASDDAHADGAELALDALLADRRRRCDVLRLVHGGPESGDAGREEAALYALGTVSLGFAAAVAHRVNRSLKSLGVLGYTLGVLLELVRLPVTRFEARLGLAGSTSTLRLPAVFAAAQNVAYTGGRMCMAPSADPTDGVAELVTLERVGRLELLRAFPRIFRGDHVDHPAVAVHRFDRLELMAPPPQLVMLDGEVLELAPRVVEVVPRAIEIWI